MRRINLATRMLLQVGREPSYANEPEHLSTLLAVDVGYPTARATTVNASFSAPHLLREKVRMHLPSWSTWNFSVLPYHDGPGSVPPPWFSLLTMCGFLPWDGDETSLTVTSGTPKSYELRFYGDGYMAGARGARGNVTLSAQAGQPLGVHFSASGIYNKPTAAEFPEIPRIDPRSLLRFCNSDVMIVPKGADPIKPVTRAVEINVELDLVPVNMSSSDTPLTEYRPAGTKITWQLSIEADTGNDPFWQWLLEEPPVCSLSAMFGDSEGNHVAAVCYDGAKMVAPPAITADGSGICIVNLVFLVHEVESIWLIYVT